MDVLGLYRKRSEGETGDEGHDEENVPVKEARSPSRPTRHGKGRVVQTRVLTADVGCGGEGGCGSQGEGVVGSGFGREARRGE